LKTPEEEDLMKLDGRVAIVTGSSSGIGEATARQMSEAGAKVVVNSATSVDAGEAVSESLPGESIYVRADISDKTQGQALIDAALDRFGPPWMSLSTTPGGPPRSITPISTH
jgi:ketoreductase RED2